MRAPSTCAADRAAHSAAHALQRELVDQVVAPHVPTLPPLPVLPLPALSGEEGGGGGEKGANNKKDRRQLSRRSTRGPQPGRSCGRTTEWKGPEPFRGGRALPTLESRPPAKGERLPLPIMGGHTQSRSSTGPISEETLPRACFFFSSRAAAAPPPSGPAGTRGAHRRRC